MKRRDHRDRLVEVQGGLCAYCFKPFSMRPDRTKGPYFWRNPRAPTMEHVVPRILGGDGPGNTIAVHSMCNNAKGGRPPTGCELVALEWVRALNGD